MSNSDRLEKAVIEDRNIVKLTEIAVSSKCDHLCFFGSAFSDQPA
ncbi:hypothetical protein PAMC26510_36225 [Caballeronia sordidicola]|uniref:Uncharacterized protein n=1 Tax=Caballeronia sordidicola TaxID=196367 RepID=A0A242M4E1_CABSO|nr:hypothetical protein PAMC26510_36225 [Caballeronia sordidicola]